jgi:hypothetical protein
MVKNLIHYPISTVVNTGLEEGLVASSLVDPILMQNQNIVYMPPKSQLRCMQQAPRSFSAV